MFSWLVDTLPVTDDEEIKRKKLVLTWEQLCNTPPGFAGHVWVRLFVDTVWDNARLPCSANSKKTNILWKQINYDVILIILLLY